MYDHLRCNYYQSYKNPYGELEKLEKVVQRPAFLNSELSLRPHDLKLYRYRVVLIRMVFLITK